MLLTPVSAIFHFALKIENLEFSQAAIPGPQGELMTREN